MNKILSDDYAKHEENLAMICHGMQLRKKFKLRPNHNVSFTAEAGKQITYSEAEKATEDKKKYLDLLYRDDDPEPSLPAAMYFGGDECPEIRFGLTKKS